MDLTYALEREWLETNGLGGFSSSTIAGLNTRRYHALLVAATKPPLGRIVLLSRIEETVVIGGVRYELSANRYPGVVHPRGYEFLERFETDPFPTFVYRLGEVELTKTVYMAHGENTTVIEYETTDKARIELRPMIAFRDYHSLAHRNDTLNRYFGQEDGLLILKPYADLPVLYLSHNAQDVTPLNEWYLNHEYSREMERGLDYREDLFSPCVMIFEGAPRASVIASLDRHRICALAELRESEKRRRAAIAMSSMVEDPLVRRLTRAADQFVVKRGDLQTIIAGYHWFGDWGRDTMISLPGITLVTGRLDVARNILLAFAETLDRGMLPNRFPDDGEQAEYNSVDSTLWFFEAIRAYVAYSRDRSFASQLMYPRLMDIIEWHLEGTRYGIRVDEDGLLQCGVPGVQLTWMDVKIGDWVVTPRHGKPVEIQALWYNALEITREIAGWAGDSAQHRFLRGLANTARKSFQETFWNEDRECLYDCIGRDALGGTRDTSIRPNQIFALSLQHPIVTGPRALQVVKRILDQLLTPMGLRSLAPQEEGYRARYGGGVYERDSAYHQGTVWPWLLGPFVKAYIRAHNRSEESCAQAAGWIRCFAEHLDEGCLGQVSEIADGGWPHAPRGCVAQAWSVAELLRALVEDVYGRAPVD